jgi:hypothetical protein
MSVVFALLRFRRGAARAGLLRLALQFQGPALRVQLGQPLVDLLGVVDLQRLAAIARRGMPAALEGLALGPQFGQPLVDWFAAVGIGGCIALAAEVFPERQLIDLRIEPGQEMLEPIELCFGLLPEPKQVAFELAQPILAALRAAARPRAVLNATEVLLTPNRPAVLDDLELDRTQTEAIPNLQSPLPAGASIDR